MQTFRRAAAVASGSVSHHEGPQSFSATIISRSASSSSQCAVQQQALWRRQVRSFSSTLGDANRGANLHRERNEAPRARWNDSASKKEAGSSKQHQDADVHEHVDPKRVARAICQLAAHELDQYMLDAKYSMRMWNSIISAIGEMDWHRGRDMLHRSALNASLPKFNTMHYNALIKTAGKDSCVTARRAFDIFQDLEQAKLEPTFVTYVLFISAIAKSGSWPDTKRALDMWTAWSRKGERKQGTGRKAAANSYVSKHVLERRKPELYNAVLNACSQYGKWGEAKDIWEEMRRLEVQCDRS